MPKAKATSVITWIRATVAANKARSNGVSTNFAAARISQVRTSMAARTRVANKVRSLAIVLAVRLNNNPVMCSATSKARFSNASCVCHQASK
jgi:hypothetical protein